MLKVKPVYVFRDFMSTITSSISLYVGLTKQVLKSYFIPAFVIKVKFPSVILYIAGYEASNFFNMVTAKRFQFFVGHRVVFTQEVIAMRAIKINRLSFIAASAVWQASLPISAIGLNNFHHLLVNRSDERLLIFLLGHSVI